MPDYQLEAALAGPVAGVDEAGRGPCAGPVVAAAVILIPARLPAGLLGRLDDSKALSAQTRADLAEELRDLARAGADGGIAYALGAASRVEIDRVNILQASLMAMRRAVRRLPDPPAFALIDGNKIPADLPCPARAVIGGDKRSLSIAAASILAKVTRDKIMRRLDQIWPGYGWARNAGYQTAEHLAALARLGASPHHRTSFAPVRRLLTPS